MTHLPADVLFLIFPLLVQRDQLECMTVCRQWYDIIHYYSLFRVIYIHRQQKLDQLIEKIKRDPILGQKVERLIVHLEIESDYDETIFIELFPNLREFTLMKYDDSCVRIESLTPQQSQPWCDGIEKIVEIMSDKITKPLLQSGVCKNLTHVAVAAQEEHDSLGDLIDALFNAPALKKLELRYYEIALEDFELLHRIVPSLSSLFLRNNTFDFTSFPPDIEPITSMSIFRSSNIEFSTTDDYIQYSRYFSQKYTHLEEMEMEICTVLWDPGEDHELAAECRSIITSHLKTLTFRLKILSIKYMACNNFTRGFNVDILDECGCQIEKLYLISNFDSSLLEKLANTTQVKYIQSLTVKSMIYGDYNFISLGWLRRFTMLKELELYFPSPYLSEDKCQLCLTDLLDVLDEMKLETLHLYSLVVEFDDTSPTRVYPSLKGLTLTRVTFNQNTDIVISQSFPNLKRLKLRHCTLQGRSLMFPNLCLSYLEIGNLYGDRNLYALLITLNNNQRRLYTMGRKSIFFQSSIYGTENDISSYPYIPSKPYDDSANIPILTVVCKSVYEFITLNTWK